MTLSLAFPKWYDLHAHFRQGPAMAAYLADHAAMGCAGILAMPNTKPPVANVFKDDPLDYWSIEGYLEDLRQAGADVFDEIIVPLYLTKDPTPAMIEAGAKAGVLKACKYYPPHGTTGAEFGFPYLEYLENGVFEAMRDCGVVLCMHGEEHGLCPEDYFGRKKNAEEMFYQERVPRVLEKVSGLKVVAEHITTKVAADLVREAADNVGATITPQHLLYTVGDLLQGLKYHLYCLPLLKFDEDRQALRDAVMDTGNTKFFAGTDNAPHFKKVTECGCAAGCYTGGVAPQLYAQAFDAAGGSFEDEATVSAFKRFLCLNGAAFYGLEVPDETFNLVRKESSVVPISVPEGSVVPLPAGLVAESQNATLAWRLG